MPHYCAECGQLLDVEEGDHRVGEDPCPRCRSRSVNARALAGTINARATVHPPSIASRLDWSLVWLRIAHENVEAAFAARHRDDQSPSDALSSEFDAGLVAIGAASFAVEAEKIRVAGDRRLSTRPLWSQAPNAGDYIGQFLLEQGLAVPEEAESVGMLFSLRNRSVHPPDETLPMKWHPRGTHTSPELVDFCAEAAANMVEVAERAVSALRSLR